MVNAVEIFGVDPAMGHPERALALTYAKSGLRDPLVAVFALDATLAKLARQTREPIVAQLRLAWWRDALGTLGDGTFAGQPILAALHRSVADHRVDPATLIAVVDGWEALVTGDIPAHTRDRGQGLFKAAAELTGADDAWLGDAGEGWAVADLALTSPDPAIVAAARADAIRLLDHALTHRASRAARPLGALTLIARMDLDASPVGSPARIARLLRYRIIGR